MYTFLGRICWPVNCNSGKIYNLGKFICFLNPIVYLFANFMYSPVPGLPCLTGVMRKQPNG